MKKNNELLARVVKDGLNTQERTYCYVIFNKCDCKFYGLSFTNLTTHHNWTYVCTREEYEDAKFTTNNVESTITERGNRYGKFKDGADIMQNLKDVMRATPNWSNLSSSQREALEMIQHKIGRVLNGDPNYVDNWHDIQGYAQLIEEELNGNVK